MIAIKSFIDSTYLKTPAQEGLSDAAHEKKVSSFVKEAISAQYKAIIVRPEYVSKARKWVDKANSRVLVGTVIDFPEGTGTLKAKLNEAKKAIADGADELDFVCNYKAFKRGKIALVKEQVKECTQLALSESKTIKWIIEVAALNELQMAQLSALIKNVVMRYFKESDYGAVFVKSSTGFYPSKADHPNGATLPAIIMMLENAAPLPVKAAGGIRSWEDAVQYINLGVKRIGTSAAREITHRQTVLNDY
jgi:deoxyribose-phosphate aldolase